MKNNSFYTLLNILKRGYFLILKFISYRTVLDLADSFKEFV